MARAKSWLIAKIAEFGHVKLTGDETANELELIYAGAQEGTTPGDVVKEPVKPGIVKEWTHNGHRMQRVRKENGSTVDIRI